MLFCMIWTREIDEVANPIAVAGVLRFLYTGDVADTDMTHQCMPDLLIITDQWQL